jgi:hypothetical protein
LVKKTCLGRIKPYVLVLSFGIEGPGKLIFIVGMADFLSALFFGFTTTQGPLQLFSPPVPMKLIMFPTGMIPLFLMPYAIFFHVLSLLTYLKFQHRH